MHTYYRPHIDYEKSRYVITKEAFIMPMLLSDEEKEFLDSIELDEEREMIKSDMLLRRRMCNRCLDEQDVAYVDLFTGDTVYEILPTEVEKDSEFKEILKSLQDNIIVFNKENASDDFIKRMTELYEDSNVRSTILDVFNIKDGKARRYSVPGFSKSYEERDEVIERVTKQAQDFKNVDAVKICVNGNLY